MTQNQYLLTAAESAEIAGVSLDTIEQYRDFGLLEATDKDGIPHFKEADIRSLFYTKLRDDSSADNQESISQEPAGLDGPTLSSILSVTELETDLSTPSQADEAENLAKEKFSEEVECQPSFEENAADWAECSISNSNQNNFNERLPAIRERELVQVNKTLQEQVEMLKEERNWLRTRIERLEARSEREQMLLLSESETVRRLVEPVHSRRLSFWRRALPFFGAD